MPEAASEDDLLLRSMFTAHPGESIDASYVIGRAIELIARRPSQVFGIAVASAVLGALLTAALLAVQVLDNTLWARAGVDDIMHPVSVVAILLIAWSVGLLLQAPLVGSAIEIHTDGRGLFAGLWQRAIARLPRMLAASFLVTIIVIVVLTVAIAAQALVGSTIGGLESNFARVLLGTVGALLILYLALKAIAGFCLVVPVILVEDLPVGDAIKRSWALGWRNGMAILWALLLPALLAQAVLFPTQFMPWYVGAALGAILGMALALYNTVVVPVSYVAIREYVDGLHPGRLLQVVRRR